MLDGRHDCVLDGRHGRSVGDHRVLDDHRDGTRDYGILHHRVLDGRHDCVLDGRHGRSVGDHRGHGDLHDGRHGRGTHDVVHQRSDHLGDAVHHVHRHGSVGDALRCLAFRAWCARQVQSR